MVSIAWSQFPMHHIHFKFWADLNWRHQFPRAGKLPHVLHVPWNRIPWRPMLSIPTALGVPDAQGLAVHAPESQLIQVCEAKALQSGRSHKRCKSNCYCSDEFFQRLLAELHDKGSPRYETCRMRRTPEHQPEIQSLESIMLPQGTIARTYSTKSKEARNDCKNAPIRIIKAR